MSRPVSVKVSRRFQIAVPRAAREQLNIRAGDRLLVDVQDGILVLIPEPSNYAERLEGLHREIWEGVDTTAYLKAERGACNCSADE